MNKRAPLTSKICLECNEEFFLKPFELRYHIRFGKFKYCSRACVHKAQSKERKGTALGSANPNWRGGRHFEKRGYVSVSIFNKNKREHRVIMEKIIGRQLHKDECVHHINGTKTDNRPENLEIISRSEHSKLHLPKGLNPKKRKALKDQAAYLAFSNSEGDEK